MKKHSLLFLLGLSALASGCPRNQYVIEMKPVGNVLERTLTCWREDGTNSDGRPSFRDFPKDEVESLASLFAKHEVSHDGKKHIFSGEVRTQTPKDVGGQGSYSRFVTDLGTAFLYVERFRGQDDLHAKLEQRLKAADQLVDILIGWSKSEMDQHPNYENLRQFLHDGFRKDVKNLSHYCSMAEVAAGDKSKALEEFMARFGQYLAERGYFSARDLPLIVRAGDDPKPRLLFIQRLVATKLGLRPGQPIPTALSFLSNPEAAHSSLEKYLRGRPEFQTRLKLWENEKKSQAGSKMPQPFDVAEELISQIMDFDSGTPDHLTVKLALPNQPVQTNGKWNEKSGELVWEADFEQKQSSYKSLPVFCYANWSSADERAQQKHFGQTTLEGKGLVEYCLWQNSLTPDEAKEWEALIASLRPDNARENLAAFRFSSDIVPRKTPEGKESTSLAELPRQLITAGLATQSQPLRK